MKYFTGWRQNDFNVYAEPTPAGVSREDHRGRRARRPDPADHARGLAGAGKDVSFGGFNTSIMCLGFCSDSVVQGRYSNYGAPEVFHTQDTM